MRKLLLIVILFFASKIVFAASLPHHAQQKLQHKTTTQFISVKKQAPVDNSENLFDPKFVSSGPSGYFAGFNSKELPTFEGSLKVAKGSSVGLSYPVTSKLFLNGQYVVLSGKQIGDAIGQTEMPVLSAMYRFNARTSISISYKNITNNPGTAFSDKSHHTTAELKIHF